VQTPSHGISHLITVPPGVPPTDALLASPIMQMQHGFGGGMAGGGGGGNFEEYGGGDSAQDPDMAMAIRASLELSRATEESRATSAATQGASGGGSSSSAPAAFAGAGSLDLLDDDPDFQMALMLSMGGGPSVPEPPSAVEIPDQVLFFFVVKFRHAFS